MASHPIFIYLFIALSSVVVLKFLAKMEENKDEIKFSEPGLEFLVFSLSALVALLHTTFQPKWLAILCCIYMVICAETDYKEHVVYRICHYPVILASAIILYLNYGVNIKIPFVFIILLVAAHVLKAYKSGDTWMFGTLGLFLMSQGFDDLYLLSFWLISIVFFMISNITKIRYAPLDDNPDKKVLRFTKAQPIGPSICLAFMFIVFNGGFHF